MALGVALFHVSVATTGRGAYVWMPAAGLALVEEILSRGDLADYRFAHAVQQRAEMQQASTEDLREALLRYRSLFDELLRPEGNGTEGSGTEGNGAAGVTADQAHAQVPAARAAGQADGLGAGESDSAGPVVPDTEYDNQQIGRREGR